MKKVLLLLAMVLTITFAGVEPPTSYGGWFSVYSENGGMKVMAFEKGLVAFASLVKAETNENGARILLLQNTYNNDDYIVVSLQVFDYTNGWYVYDIVEDDKVINFLKRVTKTDMIIVSQSQGGIFGQDAYCNGFTRYYNQLRD